MRSLLFVPGDQPAKIEKAAGSGADALVLDLEDSVAPARKAAAREIVAATLASWRHAPRLIVRVNPLHGPDCEADLDAVASGAPSAILLPKANGGQDVMLLGAKLATREAMANLPDGAIRIIAIATETGASMFSMGTYQGASRRLEGLAWGGEDLSADLGAEANHDATGAWTEPYRLARSLCLFASAAAQVTAIDTVHTAFRDLTALRAEAEEARRDGFGAKFAIHPAQVPVINEVFTPTAAAVERAEAILAAFAAAPGAGVVALDGEMLDRPHRLRAERVLAHAEAAGLRRT